MVSFILCLFLPLHISLVRIQLAVIHECTAPHRARRRKNSRRKRTPLLLDREQNEPGKGHRMVQPGERCGSIYHRAAWRDGGGSSGVTRYLISVVDGIRGPYV